MAVRRNRREFVSLLDSRHPYESLDILPSSPIESPYKRLGGQRAQPLIRPNLKYTFHFSTVVAAPLYSHHGRRNFPLRATALAERPVGSHERRPDRVKLGRNGVERPIEIKGNKGGEAVLRFANIFPVLSSRDDSDYGTTENERR